MTQLNYPPATSATYADPAQPNHFSAERRQLHDKIIEEIFAKAEQAKQHVELEERRVKKKERITQWIKGGRIGDQPSTDVPETDSSNPPEQPTLLVIAGGPGSGKSVLSAWLRRQKIFDGKFVTISSKTFSGLPEFKEVSSNTGHPHPEKSPTLNEEYYYLRRKFMEEAIKRGFSVIIDDHFDNFPQDKELVEMAKGNGYLTVLTGITPQPYPYFEHILPSDKYNQRNYAHAPWVLGLHQSFPKRWEEITPLFDYSFLYQNIFQKDTIRTMPIAMILSQDTISTYKPATNFKDKERYEQFREWETVNPGATKFEEAFHPRETEEPDDFERRMGRDTERSRGRRPENAGAKPSGDDKRGFAERLTALSQEAIVEPIIGLS